MEVSGFPHQVGGHFGLLSISGHVCKPLNQREYEFYLQMDRRLIPFTPKMCSCIKVQCVNQNSDDGLLRINTETFVNCHQVELGNNHNEATTSDTSSTLSCSSNSSSGCSVATCRSLLRMFRVNSGRVEANMPICNSWAGQCQIKLVQKLLKGHEKSFIVLEDLVAKYSQPCVIDLKMGTRQYGDDASAQKRIMQTQKCYQSTSSVFGVRLVGMQLYDRQCKKYIFVNKYEGRRMDQIQFHNTLFQFFKIAGKRRIRRVIDELLDLRKILVDGDGFRFFSSSLLIAYDGEKYANSTGNHVITIKMIDFAHSTFNGFLDDKPYSGIDEGYLLGVDSLINILKSY